MRFLPPLNAIFQESLQGNKKKVNSSVFSRKQRVFSIKRVLKRLDAELTLSDKVKDRVKEDFGSYRAKMRFKPFVGDQS